MALFRKFFYRKPPDGLLEISERVYVFDCCFTTDVSEEDEYKVYIGGIVSQLRDHFPDASFMVFNFREGESQSQISNILSEYDMTVMDYPRHYEACPLLTMEMIHHFLRSSESWLSLGLQNVLLMHCERGGWPVLAFMLAALLIYRKQYTGEQKTLDMIYKQAPRELLQLMSPLNPLPSQLRYLQYVSRRNVGSEWPPLDRALTLDCVILRAIPNLDGEGGCCPIFRIYGQDPFMAADRTPKVLFSTPKRSKLVRHYKQAERELVKIDIHCHVQGDVVLECISLEDDMEREEMMFRVMFNTAFIRSNILMLNRDEIDILWNSKDQFPKDFRVEVLLSEMDAASSLVSIDLPSVEEKGLPMEAFARVHEIFSNVDWLDSKTDAALNVLHHIKASNILPEKLEMGSPKSVETGKRLPETSPEKVIEKLILGGTENKTGTPILVAEVEQIISSLKPSLDENSIQKKIEPQESQVALQLPAQSQINSPKVPQTSLSPPVLFSNSLQESPLSRYHSSPSALGITNLLHDNAAASGEEVTYPVTKSPPLSSTSISSLPKQVSLTTSLTTVMTQEGIDKLVQASNASVPLPPPSVLPPPPSFSLEFLVESPITTTKTPKTPPPPLPPTQFTSKPTDLLAQYPPTTLQRSDQLSPVPPPPPPPLLGIPPSSTLKIPLSTTSSAPPLPSSGASPSPMMKKLISSPPPPPPLPNPSFSGVSSLSVNDSISAPPPPPLPKIISSDPCPVSPSLSSKTVITSGPPLPPPPPARSVPVSPPPPPPSPGFPRKDNSAHVPHPPPAPSANGLSKLGGASQCGGNVPPIPGPPSGAPFSLKGRSLPRMSPKNQAQPRKSNLKPYHWLKLTRAMQGSLWAETQKPDEASKAPEFDMSELESLFSTAMPNSDIGSPSGKTNRRASGPKPEKVQLIDLRRAYNCEIMLTKVKIPLPDLVASVLALDDSALDVDQVENLIKFCPTKEEMELLKNYKGDKENLGKCEQFFLELMKVPRIECKLRVFSFKMQFSSQVSDLRNHLNVVNSASEEMRNSVKLKRIMQTILSLGNALNHGTARGSAIGFRLDSLLKLTDTRARNNKMTLMHYLCKVIAEKLPELLDFPKDLISLEASTKIQLKYLAEEMQAVSKGLEKVIQELSASENDGPVSENFCKTLMEFLGFAEAEVRSLASLYSSVGRNADALALYFGEDPARCPFEQVVSTLLNFVRMFIKAHQENCKQIEFEKKKAQKEAENEKLKVSTPEKQSQCAIQSPIKSGHIK